MTGDALRLEHVDGPVLDDVSLVVAQGELTCVVGPNGAGKTTLLRTVLGWLPFDGQVHLFGRSLRTLTQGERAHRVAYVPQRSELNAAFSVIDVVRMGRYVRGRDDSVVRGAVARMGLSSLVARRFTELSGGERQRVLIARALATEAPLLLLDEPTLNLDLRHRLEMMATLREIVAAGSTVVCVLHDVDLVERFAHRSVVIHRGRVVARGKGSGALDDSVLARVFGVRRGQRGFSLLGGEGMCP